MHNAISAKFISVRATTDDVFFSQSSIILFREVQSSQVTIIMCPLNLYVRIIWR